MIFKKGTSTVFLIFIFFLFFAGQLAAQMHPIYRFKNVTIPVNLRIGDSILPKGAYDLEFLRVSSPLAYFLRIMKKGKILHLLQGEDFQYDNSSTIPKNPTLKMSKNNAEKSLAIVFESGMYQIDYAKLRMIFHIEYEED